MARANKSALLVGGLFALVPAATLAETRLERQRDAIRIEMRDASVQEVLSLLAENYGLRFRTHTKLDRRITGTGEGPLARVIARVLDGYDYVVKNVNGSTEIVVLGIQRTSRSVEATLPAPSQPISPQPSTLPTHPPPENAKPTAPSKPQLPSFFGATQAASSSPIFPGPVVPSTGPPAAFRLASPPNSQSGGASPTLTPLPFGTTQTGPSSPIFPGPVLSSHE
jgi:hypothetical protein